MGLRLARQSAEVETTVVSKLVGDPSPQVRRERAIALRHEKTARAAKLWAELAIRHDGKDRWYLEALGLSSDLNADAASMPGLPGSEASEYACWSRHRLASSAKSPQATLKDS